MQAIETELETAEFEALWLQARCYEGCVSVGLVRTSSAASPPSWREAGW